MKEFSFTSLLFLTVIFSTSSANADDNETLQADILFLKIQELEVEIADLRNKVESQSHLIKKLIAESVTDEEAGQPNKLSISGYFLMHITGEIVRFEHYYAPDLDLRSHEVIA